MALTSLNTFSPSLAMNDACEQGMTKRLRNQLRIAFFVLMAAVMMLSPEAFAQSQGEGLCSFAAWLKNVATTAAIVALILLVLNSFFLKSSVVGDIIMYVVIGCVIIAAAPEVIQITGLSPSCSY